MITNSVNTLQNSNQIKSSKMALQTEDFLKMMITQLQNQDPMDPMKNQDLLAQMSQIGQLQSTTQLQNSISSMILQNQIGSASGLIGKLVMGTDDNNNTVSGQVQSVQIQNNLAYLQLDNGALLQLGKVTAIAGGKTGTTASATTGA